jgi:uncharacterized protein with WD repeat
MTMTLPHHPLIQEELIEIEIDANTQGYILDEFIIEISYNASVLQHEFTTSDSFKLKKENVTDGFVRVKASAKDNVNRQYYNGTNVSVVKMSFSCQQDAPSGLYRNAISFTIIEMKDRFSLIASNVKGYVFDETGGYKFSGQLTVKKVEVTALFAYTSKYTLINTAGKRIIVTVFFFAFCRISCT